MTKNELIDKIISCTTFCSSKEDMQRLIELLAMIAKDDKQGIINYDMFANGNRVFVDIWEDMVVYRAKQWAKGA